MTKVLIRILYGVLARMLNIFIPVQKKHWIFGADFGNSYREGSKYLLEYMVKNHPDFTCTFVTDKKDVKKELDSKGIPCVMNNSIIGIIEIAKADVVITAQFLNDIRFVFKKKKRSYYYLLHGQPYKKAINAMSDKASAILSEKSTFKKQLFCHLMKWFVYNYDLSDVSFMSATSDFMKPWMELTIGNDVPMKILGSPRNDGLFNHSKMKSEKWVEGIDGKIIVTYMPTHRLYGKGELSPIPFEHNKDIQEWLRTHNVVLLVKQHPNMIPKLNNPINTDVIKDITKMTLDPQVVIYNTDVLITDYSSVFIDFLLFKRPILFYIYDNYEDVEGCLYDIHGDFPNSFCYNENELFERIKDSILDKDHVAPTIEVVNKFHKYIDDKSCERYYQEIIKEKYN